jgi:hypothetical protein
VLSIPSKSRDLADENNKHLTEWKWFETIVLFAILLKPFGFLLPKIFKVFDFPIFILWEYLTKVIPETRVLTFDHQLKKILTFSVKDRYQLNYFICIIDFNKETITSCCSVPHYLSDIRNIYIKTDRFHLMVLTAANKERKQM